MGSSLMSKAKTGLRGAGNVAQGIGQEAGAVATTGVAIDTAKDALMSEEKMNLLVKQARQQGLWSVVTKQADAQSSRMAKQSEAWAQI